ncbi:MAG: flagellar basal body L-ring protein FlgH [Pirellulaceae bacterium]
MRHRNTAPVIWVLLATLAGVATPAFGQTLFERRSMNQIDQYRTFAARHRGDLLSVLVTENTAIENRDERLMQKQGSSTYAGGLDYGLDGGLGSTEGAGTLGHTTSSARTFDGDSEFRSQRRFTDQFTVAVVDVLPNGNLLIAGERQVIIQGDKRQLKLSGIVRQYDVLPNNMVPSHLIANLKMDLVADGPEQAYGKQGWFSRRMNKWWPF